MPGRDTLTNSNPSLTLRTTWGAGWLVSWQMATRSLGFLSTLVLTHLLAPADFCLVAMALTFAAAINALSNLKVADALVRRPDTAERWYDTAFTLQALRDILTAGAIVLGSGSVATWFGEPRLVQVLWLLAFNALLASFENIGIVEFRRNMRFDIEFRLLLMPRLLQFCVALGLAYYWRDYRALVIGNTAGAALRLILTHAIHRYRPACRWSTGMI